MAQNITYFIAITLIASFAGYAHTYQCFNCVSNLILNCRYTKGGMIDYSFDCDDIAPPTHLLDDYSVHSRATGCMTKIVEDAYGERIIQRSCYFGNASDQERGCRNPPWESYKTLSYSICYSDNCNSKAIDDESIENSSFTVKGSLASVIAVFYAVTRWVS